MVKFHVVHFSSHSLKLQSESGIELDVTCACYSIKKTSVACFQEIIGPKSHTTITCMAMQT